jgi:hypothetical protein
VRWSREALRARLRHLSERHSGKELVDALVAFADTLEEEDREKFRAVLLERSDQIQYDWAAELDQRRRRRRRLL